MKNASSTPKLCTVGECSRVHIAKGLCGTHYYRQQHGLELDPPIKPNAFTAQSVYEYYAVESEHGVLWTGSVKKENGYGVASFDDKQTYAHRLAWELKVGPIPSGMEVDHRPDCPKNCVTVEHLTLRTKSDHAKEGWKRGQFDGNGWTEESRAKRMRTKECAFCGSLFTKVAKALYCSTACNQKAFRRRNR